MGRRRADRVVGASAANQQTVDQASTAARSDLPVLILGPRGAGKLHVARALHAWSGRAGAELVVLEVDGLPDGLHARELFGARDGSEALLSGERRGALERAAGGTLVVHGIDRLSGSVREALLQAVKGGAFQRDGDAAPVPLRTRLVATAADADPAWLGDLSPLVVRVAPLSERLEDVLPLAAHFLALFAEEEGIKPVGFTAEARQCLVDEPWSGNVRELRERIRQAVRLAGDGVVSVEALLLSADGETVPSFKEAKRSFETRYVRSLLRRCSGNISRAARLAKKDRKDFYDVIRRTGVDPAEFRS